MLVSMHGLGWNAYFFSSTGFSTGSSFISLAGSVTSGLVFESDGVGFDDL